MPARQRSRNIMSPNNSEIAHIQIPNSQIIPQMIKLMEKGHSVTLRLRGISMRPFLEDNRDKAILRKPAAIKAGDVVLAEIGDRQYALHRIINIHEDTVILQGDGNLTTETCNVKDVHGIAIGFYRKGRTTLEKTDGKKWKTYSAIWTALKPIRRYLLAFHRIIWLGFFQTKKQHKTKNKET